MKTKSLTAINLNKSATAYIIVLVTIQINDIVRQPRIVNLSFIRRKNAANRYKPINENVEYPITMKLTDNVSPKITSKAKNTKVITPCCLIEELLIKAFKYIVKIN